MNLYVGNTEESKTLLRYLIKHKIKCKTTRVKKEIIMLEIGDIHITGLNDVFNYLKEETVVKPVVKQKPDDFENAATRWITEKEVEETSIAPTVNFDSKISEVMSSRKNRNSPNEVVINKSDNHRKKEVEEESEESVEQKLSDRLMAQLNEPD